MFRLVLSTFASLSLFLCSPAYSADDEIKSLSELAFGETAIDALANLNTLSQNLLTTQEVHSPEELLAGFIAVTLSGYLILNRELFSETVPNRRYSEYNLYYNSFKKLEQYLLEYINPERDWKEYSFTREQLLKNFRSISENSFAQFKEVSEARHYSESPDLFLKILYKEALNFVKTNEVYNIFKTSKHWTSFASHFQPFLFPLDSSYGGAKLHDASPTMGWFEIFSERSYF